MYFYFLKLMNVDVDVELYWLFFVELGGEYDEDNFFFVGSLFFVYGVIFDGWEF